MNHRICIILLLVVSLNITANELVDSIAELKDAGVLLVDTQGKTVVSSQAERAFIPASTTKLVTAWLALNHWGEDHHFKTDFYFDDLTNTLWVKGSGDPFLVSEELVIIASNLKQLGIQNIDAIGLDVSLFEADLIVPGSSATINPYDAVPTAIAANFNTIAIKKVAGKIMTAESQTPLTLFAANLANQQALSKRTLRINTGMSSHNAERYFAELLATFLRKQGVTVGRGIIWGQVPQQSIYYRHINSKSLAEIIQPMMKYSTNFIANQLILMLSAEHYQHLANFNDVKFYMEEILQKEFNWKTVSLKEGAGLSRKNKLSPKQLVQLLESFRPWKHLLPEVTPSIYAKSGTLNNVSTLAGYAVDSNQRWNAFAIMMKQSVSHRRRNQIASELRDFLNHQDIIKP
ncbi:MAG: D-alanyl-D-alanine carboxypeptidase [Methylophaga sp.]|nr:D-alanyl-D-alanine carboxypeptidase [Methylophaga sp.]